MRVLINETKAIEVLSLIDSNTGIDYVEDFIGNYDALNDGQFTWDEEAAAFLADQDTFNWWSEVIRDEAVLAERIAGLKVKHDSDEVDAVVHAAADVDLEDYASAVNKALDEEFGVPAGK